MTAANCEDVRCQASELINRVAADLQYVDDGARLWRLTAGEPSEKWVCMTEAWDHRLSAVRTRQNVPRTEVGQLTTTETDTHRQTDRERERAMIRRPTEVNWHAGAVHTTGRQTDYRRMQSALLERTHARTPGQPCITRSADWEWWIWAAVATTHVKLRHYLPQPGHVPNANYPPTGRGVNSVIVCGWKRHRTDTFLPTSFSTF